MADDIDQLTGTLGYTVETLLRESSKIFDALYDATDSHPEKLSSLDDNPLYHTACDMASSAAMLNMTLYLALGLHAVKAIDDQNIAMCAYQTPFDINRDALRANTHHHIGFSCHGSVAEILSRHAERVIGWRNNLVDPAGEPYLADHHLTDLQTIRPLLSQVHARFDPREVHVEEHWAAFGAASTFHTYHQYDSNYNPAAVTCGVETCRQFFQTYNFKNVVGRFTIPDEPFYRKVVVWAERAYQPPPAPLEIISAYHFPPPSNN